MTIDSKNPNFEINLKSKSKTVVKIKNRKVLGIIIIGLSILISRELGIISFRYYQYDSNSTINHTIRNDSIKEKNNSIKVIWKDYKYIYEDSGEIIYVQITKFDKSDLRLFIPLYKKFDTEIEAEVKSKNNERIGSIKFTLNMTIKGICSRHDIIQMVEKKASKDIVAFIHKITSRIVDKRFSSSNN